MQQVDEILKRHEGESPVIIEIPASARSLVPHGQPHAPIGVVSGPRTRVARRLGGPRCRAGAGDTRQTRVVTLRELDGALA